tara:strand:- start:1542 stop:2561 length:1020 start_codon:yes stop_codon:yes gene_type:complete
MADYKAIKGLTIQTVSGDPPSPLLGQMWYNSTTGKLRSGVSQAAAWATGGLLTNRRYSMMGAGDKTAGLGFGGYFVPSVRAFTEKYDGSSWTEVGDMNTARMRGAGFGTDTAAVGVGGQAPAITNVAEEWNGASWTTVTSIPSPTSVSLNLGGSGTQTSGLVMGGGAAPANTNVTSEYDGSSWTAGGNLNLTRGGLCGTGTQTASLAMGGNYTPPPGVAMTADAEDYNGTAWTEIGDMSVARGIAGGGGGPAGAITFGGESPPAPSGVKTSDVYDGSSWAAGADLPGVVNRISGAAFAVGNTLGYGGYRYLGSPSPSDVMQESWEYSDVTTVGSNITTS